LRPLLLPPPGPKQTEGVGRRKGSPSNPAQQGEGGGQGPVESGPEACSPPWWILFFSTERFVAEMLCVLQAAREPEVVTLPLLLLAGLPVKNCAEQNQLLTNFWPDTGPSHQFNVGMVASFGCLLGEELILQFPYGVLNVHPSYLPWWHGSAPIIHMVLHGDTVTGVTVMQIKPKRFDVGPSVNQEKFAVSPGCTAKELEGMLSKLSADMLISVLENLPESNQRKELRLPLKSDTGKSGILPGVPPLDNIPDFSDQLLTECRTLPGSVLYHEASQTLVVCFKGGWVGVKASPFIRGYKRPYFQRRGKPKYKR
uniref:Formyl transferase N-terminal domain-containing protein n=1 Tax=Sphenodon punctatus TaxID=8508 RepID=A0A8D0GWN5_SPHPU